jgi:hypothetical protein
LRALQRAGFPEIIFIQNKARLKVYLSFKPISIESNLSGLRAVSVIRWEKYVIR